MFGFSLFFSGCCCTWKFGKVYFPSLCNGPDLVWQTDSMFTNSEHHRIVHGLAAPRRLKSRMYLVHLVSKTPWTVLIMGFPCSFGILTQIINSFLTRVAPGRQPGKVETLLVAMGITTPTGINCSCNNSTGCCAAAEPILSLCNWRLRLVTDS